MFKKINLKSRYTVPRDDLAKNFINPLLKESIRYDRVAGFFSSKALSYYSEGIEELAKKSNSKYRLIISEVISKEDYNLIKQGYELRKELEEGIINRLDEDLTPHEEKNFSNLAYLISIGLVDIKIGFIHKGLFHSKFGFFYDENDNIVYFTGSINETENAIKNNYEEIFVYCNWLEESFYQHELKKATLDFEKMWNNKDEIVITIDPTKLIKNKLETFNKNRIISDEIELTENSIILDCKSNNISMILNMNQNKQNEFYNDGIFEYYIEPFKTSGNNNSFIFKEMSITEIEILEDNIQKLCHKLNLNYVRTENIENFIKNKKINLENLNKFGKYIKMQHNCVMDEFIKFKSTVDLILDRKLKDKQMWDAFFMYKMKKSANFSVPGSGKTSVVLGCFAYLYNLKKVNKIVVISPKNSFGTWIDEFKINLSKNIKLNVFNCHDPKFKNNIDNKKYYLKYHANDCNLFLFNYESISQLKDCIKNIISDDTLLVFDEVHKIKRVNGKYAESSLEIAKNANYTVVLTGTPIPNSYSDIYNMLKILYYYEYNDFFGYRINELKDISNSEIKKLNNKLFPFFCRTTKKDLNVPPVNPDKEFNCLANEYEQRIFEILHNTLHNNHLAFFVRLMQLESNPKLLLNAISQEILKEVFEEDFEDLENSKIKDYTDELFDLVNKIDSTTKFNKCVELVKSLVDENKPVILWCIFKDTIKKFENVLNSLNIKAMPVYGDIELENRENIISNFKNGKIKVLITNPHTLAESISLHNICHDAIYFEYSYNLVHFLQSKDRIHRLGLKEDQYTQLYFMNMIYKFNNNDYCFGQKIYERLMEKEKIMLDCIENNIIENPQPMDEDLKKIFDSLD